MRKRIKKHFELLWVFWQAWRKVKVDKLIAVLMITANIDRRSTSAVELERVAKFIGIPSDKLQKKTRKGEIVEARQVAMYLARRNTRESLASIGSAIGNKDHATVLHACKTVGNYLETNREFREKWLPLINPAS